MGKTKSYLCGFLIGGVAAGLTVLLTTPKSGKALRRDIKERLEDARISDLGASIAAVKTSVESFVNKGLPALQSTVEEIRTIVETWRHDIQPNVQKIASGVKQLDKERKAIVLNQDKPKPPSD